MANRLADVIKAAWNNRSANPVVDFLSVLFPNLARTPAEIAAGVVPVAPSYPVGTVDRYGTNTVPGTTDMTAAAMAAVQVANQAGGGVVYWLGAKYLVGSSGTFVSYVFSNILHQGASREATQIINGSTNQPAISCGDGTTQLFGGGVRSMNFTQQSGVTAVTGNCGFKFSKLGQFIIEDVFVSNAIGAPYRGVMLTSCSQFEVRNQQVQGCLFDGATNLGGIDAYMTDCRSDANGGAGIVLNAAQGCFYKSCTAFNNSGVGWALISGAPASAPNKNNSFLQCVGDTSGSYNWQINDSQDSVWIDCWGGTQLSTTVNTFAAGFIIGSQFCTRLGFVGCIAITNNSHGFQVFDGGAAAPTFISFDNCFFTKNGQAAGGGYGFTCNGASDHLRVTVGVFSGNITGPLLNQSSGTDIVVAGNPVGFVTANQGAGTIAIAATTVVITHGLGFTPAVQNIQCPASDTSSRAASGITSVWVSAPTATTFTVNCNAAVAGAAYNFTWKASYNGA